MLTPGYANLWAHWYPIGNTPAVCLTQGLPPESKADILLLGCGDVRNILFTVHCDGTVQPKRRSIWNLFADVNQEPVRWT